MPLQLSISFDPTHIRENNPLSESHLNQYRDKFTHDCFEVLKELVKGEMLTMKSAIISGLTGDLRRRVKDLKDFGIPVQAEYLENKGVKDSFKTYYMTDSDKGKALEVLLNKAAA